MAKNRITKQMLRERADELEMYARRNVIELDTFLDHEYSQTNPKPEENKVRVPVELLGGILFGLSTAFASGLRVFDRFYTVAYASSLNATIALLESVFAVISINGAILLLPFIIRKAISSISNKQEANEEAVNQWTLRISLGVAVFISFVAGLGQSVVGLSAGDISNDAAASVVEGIDWILAFALSLLTALEYFFGDIISRFLNGYLEKRDAARDAHSSALKSWRASGKTQFKRWINQYDSMNEEEDGETQVKSSGRGVSKKSQKTKIMSFVNQMYEKNGKTSVPTFSDVMDAIIESSIAKNRLENNESAIKAFKKSKRGVISTARKQWMEDNGLSDN